MDRDLLDQAAMVVSPEDAHGSVDEELYLPVTERPFSSPS